MSPWYLNCKPEMYMSVSRHPETQILRSRSGNLESRIWSRSQVSVLGLKSESQSRNLESRFQCQSYNLESWSWSQNVESQSRVVKSQLHLCCKCWQTVKAWQYLMFDTDIEKILRLCCDADWSMITGTRSSARDPVFAVLAQNAVGRLSE